MEFSETDVARIQRAFRVDREAAIARLEYGAASTAATVEGYNAAKDAPIDSDGS